AVLPLLTTASLDARKQCALAASAVLHTEAIHAIAPSRAILRPSLITVVQPPLAALLRKWRSAFAFIPHLTDFEGHNPFLRDDDRALATDAAADEASLALLQVIWVAALASPPASTALAAMAAAAGPGSLAPRTTLTSSSSASSLSTLSSAPVTRTSTYPSATPATGSTILAASASHAPGTGSSTSAAVTRTSSHHVPPGQPGASSAVSRRMSQRTGVTKTGGGRQEGEREGATSSQRRMNGDKDRAQRWSLGEAMEKAWDCSRGIPVSVATRTSAAAAAAGAGGVGGVDGREGGAAAAGSEEGGNGTALGPTLGGLQQHLDGMRGLIRAQMARAHTAGMRMWRSLIRQLLESGLLVGLPGSYYELKQRRVRKGRGVGQCRTRGERGGAVSSTGGEGWGSVKHIPVAWTPRASKSHVLEETTCFWKPPGASAHGAACYQLPPPPLPIQARRLHPSNHVPRPLRLSPPSLSLSTKPQHITLLWNMRGPHPCSQVFWKLDRVESSSRMRRRMVRNYRGSDCHGLAADFRPPTHDPPPAAKRARLQGDADGVDGVDKGAVAGAVGLQEEGDVGVEGKTREKDGEGEGVAVGGGAGSEGVDVDGEGKDEAKEGVLEGSGTGDVEGMGGAIVEDASGLLGGCLPAPVKDFDAPVQMSADEEGQEGEAKRDRAEGEGGEGEETEGARGAAEGGGEGVTAAEGGAVVEHAVLEGGVKHTPGADDTLGANDAESGITESAAESDAKGAGEEGGDGGGSKQAERGEVASEPTSHAASASSSEPPSTTTTATTTASSTSDSSGTAGPFAAASPASTATTTTTSSTATAAAAAAPQEALAASAVAAVAAAAGEQPGLSAVVGSSEVAAEVAVGERERVVVEVPAMMVLPLQVLNGRLLVTASRLLFLVDPSVHFKESGAGEQGRDGGGGARGEGEEGVGGKKARDRVWRLTSVREVLSRR
ncbi:unnamed protein product, partial [Closterium sp. NIES-54]